MPLDIEFSNCGAPEVEAEIRRRSQELFRRVPDAWTVRLVRQAGRRLWTLTIRGPGHFRYQLDLSPESGEQSADFVVGAIKQAVVGELSG